MRDAVRGYVDPMTDQHSSSEEEMARADVVNGEGDPEDVPRERDDDHRTGERQAEANADNESPA